MVGRCHACGRPLSAPRSVATGIGPRCASRAAAAGAETLFKARYFFEVLDGVLVLFDRDAGSISLTNDMERVLREVAAKLGDAMPRDVVYRDSAGRYDGVRHRRGVFGGFIPIGARTLADAVAARRCDDGAGP